MCLFLRGCAPFVFGAEAGPLAPATRAAYHDAALSPMYASYSARAKVRRVFHEDGPFLSAHGINTGDPEPPNAGTRYHECATTPPACGGSAGYLASALWSSPSVELGEEDDSRAWS